MQRRICLLLALLTCSAMVTGCQEKTTEVETGDTAQTGVETVETEDADTTVRDDLPEKDFGGADMQILTTTWREITQYIYAEEENGEVINDALFSQRSYVEDRFNVEIGLTAEQDISALQTTVHNLAISGDDTYDIVYNHDLKTIGNAMKGDFFDLRQVETINFDKPWWNGSSEVFTIQGKLPFTANTLTLSGIYMNCVLAVNKGIATDLQIDIPYDSVRQGKWYLDDLITLTKIATIDLDGDGIMDTEDQWGLVTGSYAEVSMLSDLGGTVLEKDTNGTLMFQNSLEHTISILWKMGKMLEYTVDDYGAMDEYGAELFVANKSLFMFGETRIVYEKVRGEDISYGILPFPKFDENQQEYQSAGYDIYWGIPLSSAGNSELIGYCVEAMSCYNYNYVVPQVWDTVLGGKLADSPDDYDMFSIIRDIQYVDLGYAFSGESNKLSELVFLICNTDAGSVVSYMESRQSAVVTLIDKINQTYAEMP